jgi:hypothetical protein
MGCGRRTGAAGDEVTALLSGCQIRRDLVRMLACARSAGVTARWPGDRVRVVPYSSGGRAWTLLATGISG